MPICRSPVRTTGIGACASSKILKMRSRPALAPSQVYPPDSTSGTFSHGNDRRSKRENSTCWASTCQVPVATAALRRASVPARCRAWFGWAHPPPRISNGIHRRKAALIGTDACRGPRGRQGCRSAADDRRGGWARAATCCCARAYARTRPGRPLRDETGRLPAACSSGRNGRPNCQRLVVVEARQEGARRMRRLEIGVGLVERVAPAVVDQVEAKREVGRQRARERTALPIRRTCRFS